MEYLLCMLAKTNLSVFDAAAMLRFKEISEPMVNIVRAYQITDQIRIFPSVALSYWLVQTNPPRAMMPIKEDVAQFTAEASGSIGDLNW